MGAGSSSSQVQAPIAVARLREAAPASAYWELTKPRVTLMVVMTTLVGFILGVRSGIDLLLLLHTLLATALIAGGTAALNQILEVEADGKMERTRNRPIPSGRLEQPAASVFAVSLTIGGALYLGIAVNPLTAVLGVATSVLYLLLYTPLKTRTPWATAWGAIPGAIPPVMGWTAARNQLGPEALILFALLFLWQFPHFYAIAWIYKDDYRRGGFRMLPHFDPQGDRTSRHILVHSLLFAAIGLVPFFWGMAGMAYLAGAIGLGAWTIFQAVAFSQDRSTKAAKSVMRTSIIHLPLLLLLLIIG